jgi:alpha,alpha-trehalose phosphorylase
MPRFPLTYRGQLLEIEVGMQTVTYELREGESLAIHHETEEIRLTRSSP